MYLDKCRVRRLIRFQSLSAVPLAVALVCTILGIACAEQFGRAAVIALVVWFILYAVYRKGAVPLERRLNAMEQEDVVS